MNYFDRTFMKAVFKKSLPLIIGSILIGLTNLIDNLMIGVFQSPNVPELSASSLAQKYLNIAIIFVEASITIFSFLIYQYHGAKKNNEMVETVKIIIWFVAIFDAIAIIVGNFFINQIMQFFQGKNFNQVGSSTELGIAQEYSKILIFTIIPTSFVAIYLNVFNALGKHRFMAYLTAISLLINGLFNYIFYKAIRLGLDGIAYSTILGESVSVILILSLLLKFKITTPFLINPIKMFNINLNILNIGLRKIFMGMQVILWSSTQIAIQIIYSNWYGDVANERLAIVSPVSTIFYSALNGIAKTKGYFVGRQIGNNNPEQALINDKKINLYTILFAGLEGILLAILAFPIVLIWHTTDSSVQFDAAIMLITVGLTYPIAGTTKTLLGSLKAGGKGKSIILSNGLFAVLFEFMVPLILLLINQYWINLNIPILGLYIISRTIKLVKLPPTFYFWKKKKWLIKTISH